LVALMTLLWYDCELLLRTLTFFFISTSAMDAIETNLIDGCFRVPGTLFHGAWKVIFWFVLPYGVMATVPTQLLTGALTPAGAAYAVGLTVAFTAFTLWFWRFGLRHYQSASS
jgi:ABC-2 type transport system permease protein